MTFYEQKKIQKTLKDLMKQKKMTYESVGKRLKISPATVKRRLNGEDLNLRHLKEFAGCFSLSFYDLIEISKEHHREPHQFTEAQERLLSSELWIMNLFRMILAGLDLAEIKKRLNISEKDVRKVARDLEKAELAQLLPGDRFIPIVQFPFKWLPNGPLSKTYDKLIVKNVTKRIELDAGKAGLNRQFEIALSPEMYKKFCDDIQLCYEKYRNISELYLSSRINWDHLVSGVFYADFFSLWESP